MAAEPDPESLADAFWGVARSLRGRNRQVLAPWALTPSLFRATGVLARHSPIRLSALAEHLRIAPRSATEVVDDLESRGLAERSPDPGDRRATLVALTDKGRELFAEIRAARQAQSADLFAVLDERDRADLGRILRKVQDAAGQGDAPE